MSQIHTCFKYVHCSCYRHGVKVLELNFCDHVTVRFKLDLEYVTLFSLDQKEKHGFGFVSG